MAATYQLMVYSPDGALLTVIDSFSKLEYARRENEIGSLDLIIQPDTDLSLLPIDGQIEIWRTLPGLAPYLEGETAFFIRKVHTKMEASGEAIRIIAYDALNLLNRRIVAYFSDAEQADKWDAADDMMKAVVRENLGALCVDTTRDLSPYITVAGDQTLAPVFRKAFPNRRVFEVCRELSEAARQNNYYLAFDLVRTEPAHFEFRTYGGQRGIDHSLGSSNEVVVAVESGSVASPEMMLDHTSEANFIYCGGTGFGSERVITTAYDEARMGASLFGRCEAFVDGREVRSGDVGDIEKLQSDADAALRAYRPRRYFAGKIVDTPNVMYGHHYRFGDIVTAQYKGFSFDSHVEAVHITVDSSGESIEIAARGERYA